MNQQFPIFETEHLIFRQLTYQDAQEVFQLFSDPEAMKYDGLATMQQLSEAYDFIRYYSQSPIETQAIRWAGVLKSTNKLVGTAGFHHWDRENQTAELGGELHRSLWQNGLGTEGYNALLNFGFKQLGLNRITALVSPENHIAQKILEKTPFKKEGVLRQCRKWNGSFVDLELYALLKDDWLKLFYRS